MSYALVGSVVGWVGGEFVGAVPGLQLHWLSIGMAVLLMAHAFDLFRWLPGGGGKMSSRLMGMAFRHPPGRRGLLLGALTPLLPCGVLYLAFGRTLACGDVLEGALFMALFAVGSMPLLLLAQLQMGAVQRWLSPRARKWCFRGMMLVAAGMMLWRGVVQGCCHGPAGS